MRLGDTGLGNSFKYEDNFSQKKLDSNKEEEIRKVKQIKQREVKKIESQEIKTEEKKAKKRLSEQLEKELLLKRKRIQPQRINQGKLPLLTIPKTSSLSKKVDLKDNDSVSLEQKKFAPSMSSLDSTPSSSKSIDYNPSTNDLETRFRILQAPSLKSLDNLDESNPKKRQVKREQVQYKNNK